MSTKKTRLATSVRFDTASYNLRVTTGASVETLVLNVTTNRDYWLSGQGEADDANGNGDLVSLLETMLNTNGGGGTYTVSLTADGVITIACNVLFSIDWDDGATTLDKAIFGFTGNVGPVLLVASPRTVSSWWAPDLDAERSNWGEPDVQGGSAESVNGSLFAWSLGQANGDSLKISWGLIKLAHARKRFAEDAGDPTNCIEYQWLDQEMSAGKRFRIYEHPQLTMDMSQNGNYT